MLSAAHCFLTNDGKIETYYRRGRTIPYKPEDFDAVAGLHVKLDEGGPAQRKQLELWFFHDNYSFSPRIANDIAVLKMKQSFTFNRYLQPACLPKPGEELRPDQMCYISGFGYSGVKTGRGRYMERLPEVLQQGLVPIRESPECMVYRTHFRSLYHLCIGGVGIIARDGDSGGPLTCILQTKGKPKHHQVLYGLSSFSSARVSLICKTKP